MRTRPAMLLAAKLVVFGFAMPVFAQPAAKPSAYERCLSYPEAPGFHWPRAAIEAFCADWHILPIEYSEIEDLLDKGQGKQLDARFARVLADYDAGKIAEGSARQAFMANFDYGADETGKLIDRWLSQSPDSAYALAARGIHRVQRAADARGPKFFNEIPPEDIARMEQEFALAKKDLTKALLKNPKLLAAYEALINGARMTSDEALEDIALKGALEADPKNYFVRSTYMTGLQPRWGGSLEEMDQFAKDAMRYLKKNPRLASLDTQALVERAWFTQGKDSARDLPIYENALVAAPFLPALTSAGHDAEELGKHQRSIELYSQVLRFWPNSVYDLAQRARAYRQLKNFDLARADLDRALKRWPDNAPALREYAQFHQVTNDHDKAIEMLLRAREADAADNWSLQRLAWLYVYKKRDSKKAEPLVNELIKREPKSGSAWLLRCDVIQNLNQPGLRTAAENFARYADITNEEQRRALPKVKAWLANHPEG